LITIPGNHLKVVLKVCGRYYSIPDGKFRCTSPFSMAMAEAGLSQLAARYHFSWVITAVLRGLHRDGCTYLFYSIQDNEDFGQYMKCFPLVIGDGACFSPRRSCLVKGCKPLCLIWLAQPLLKIMRSNLKL
jgi:hypothetical protein